MTERRGRRQGARGGALELWGFAERMGAQVKGLHKTALILDTNRKVGGPHLRFRSAGYKFGVPQTPIMP